MRSGAIFPAVKRAIHHPLAALPVAFLPSPSGFVSSPCSHRGGFPSPLNGQSGVKSVCSAWYRRDAHPESPTPGAPTPCCDPAAPRSTAHTANSKVPIAGIPRDHVAPMGETAIDLGRLFSRCGCPGISPIKLLACGQIDRLRQRRHRTQSQGRARSCKPKSILSYFEPVITTPPLRITELLHTHGSARILSEWNFT